MKPSGSDRRTSARAGFPSGAVLRSGRFPWPRGSGCGSGIPRGGLMGLAGSPFRGGGRWCRPGSARGAEGNQRPRCRGAWAARRIPRPGATSTILPKYITATRSEIWATTDRSWAHHQVGEAEAFLQVHEQVQHLGLYGHVQGAHRLVGHHQAGAAGPGPGRCRCAGAGRR